MTALQTQTLPDFLIIGAAKSGTSTLYRYLDQHPQLCFPKEKEPCFFDRRRAWDQGWDWYRQLFSHARPDQLRGEGSTNYTFWPHVPDAAELIAKHAPDCKLIYIMRHPVERTFSHYAHRFTKELFPGKPFDKTLLEFAQIDPLILDCSDYMKQIDRFLAYFPREQMLFLFLDELVKDPEAVLLKILRFLQVDDTVDLMQTGKIVDNRGNKHREGKLRYYTTEPFRKNPIIRTVAYALPKSFRDLGYNMVSKTSYGQRMKQAFSPIPMRDTERQQLIERFGPGNERLAEFLGVDLSHWNQ